MSYLSPVILWASEFQTSSTVNHGKRCILHCDRMRTHKTYFATNMYVNTHTDVYKTKIVFTDHTYYLPLMHVIKCHGPLGGLEKPMDPLPE